MFPPIDPQEREYRSRAGKATESRPSFRSGAPAMWKRESASRGCGLRLFPSPASEASGGEGLGVGGGTPILPQSVVNCGDHLVRLLQDFIVPETQYAIASRIHRAAKLACSGDTRIKFPGVSYVRHRCYPPTPIPSPPLANARGGRGGASIELGERSVSQRLSHAITPQPRSSFLPELFQLCLARMYSCAMVEPSTLVPSPMADGVVSSSSRRSAGFCGKPPRGLRSWSHRRCGTPAPTRTPCPAPPPRLPLPAAR
jgi:hypothetical protein